MIKAVENHMPQVVVIDEIGTEADCSAARTIAQVSWDGCGGGGGGGSTSSTALPLQLSSVVLRQTPKQHRMHLCIWASRYRCSKGLGLNPKKPLLTRSADMKLSEVQ